MCVCVFVCSRVIEKRAELPRQSSAGFTCHCPPGYAVTLTAHTHVGPVLVRVYHDCTSSAPLDRPLPIHQSHGSLIGVEHLLHRRPPGLASLRSIHGRARAI